MKTSTLAIAIALISASALAQDPTPRPDYSRPTLLRVLSVDADSDEESRIRLGGGALTLTALNTRFAFLYRPMLPLAGSRPIVSQVLPDAFSLTGTALASLPRHWGDPIRRSDELVKFEIRERGRARVTVRSGSQ